MTSADSSRPPQLLALFGTIAGATFVGGCGLLVVHSLLHPAANVPPVEAALESGEGDRRFAEAIDRLTRALEASRVNTSSQSTGAEPSQRVVATESGESGASELAAAVRELRDVLQSATLGTRAAKALTLPRDDVKAKLPDLPSDVDNPERVYERQHLFWSEQQVLDHYGLPEEIGGPTADLQIWYYRPEGQRRFAIRLAQGRVISFDLQ